MEIKEHIRNVFKILNWMQTFIKLQETYQHIQFY